MRAPQLAFRRPGATTRLVETPEPRSVPRATSVESSTAHSPIRTAPRVEGSSGVIRPRAESLLNEDEEEEERPLVKRRVAFTLAPPR